MISPKAGGSSQDGGQAEFPKKIGTAPLSLMTTYRMSLISAGSISLDSTFNENTKQINTECKTAGSFIVSRRHDKALSSRIVFRINLFSVKTTYN
jgi:hypothetical protein